MSIEIGIVLLIIVGVYVTVKVQQSRQQEALKIIKDANLMGKFLLQVRTEPNRKGTRPGSYGIYQYKDEQILLEIQLSSSEADLVVLTPNILSAVVGLKVEQNGELIYKRWH